MVGIKKLLFGFIGIALPASLIAQNIPQGIQYQGAIQDSAGRWMANTHLALRISLSSEYREIYYSELQQVETDADGQFSLVIGSGKVAFGSLERVPFELRQIWLEIEMLSKSPDIYKSIERTRLFSVPYALHANTATFMIPPSDGVSEKSQSINWGTAGNALTMPPTHFLGTRDEKDLIFVTNSKERIVITKNGQVQIKSSLSGKDSLESSYPLTIKGGAQGIHIKVNGSRSSDNKYMVFGDEDNFLWGSIEGQTFSELEQDWEYNLQIRTFALGGASLGLRIAAHVVKAIGAGSSIFAAGGVAGFVVLMSSFAIEIAGLLTESILFGTKKREEIGVNYSSGAGDYAEWIPRRPGERNLEPGEIVGVKEGLVSLNTENGSDHYFVISEYPILLGNTPHEEHKEGYEKVAFMGQVAVKVAGKVTMGDYILPSGNNDGFGIAIHPSDMKTGDYARVVGVAWESSKGDGVIHFVNVAVGINTNRLSKKVDLLNRRVENILAHLEGKAPLLDDTTLAKEEYSLPPQVKPKTNISKVYTDEQFAELLDRHEPFVRNLFILIKKEVIKKGGNPDAPYLRRLFEDPVQFLKAMRSDPSLYTPWAAFDQGLPVQSKK